jgi:hypothetical protein
MEKWFMRCRGKGERGITVIAVVFILAVIGGTGLTLSYITQNLSERASEAVDVQRAYFTAQSGFDWALQTADTYGWTVDDIAILEGTRVLPNEESFTLGYDPATDTMFSTATVGKATRRLRFPGFSGFLPPAGGP